MREWQIILAQLIFLTGCQPLSGQQIAPTTPPTVMPYPISAGPQPVFVMGQPYLQPGPVLVAPGPPTSPMYGPQPMVGPWVGPGAGSEPGVVPGPGGVISQPIAPIAEMPGLGPNPIAVPVVDEELAWDQIADVVSDYFTIAREQRARRSGEMLMEGRIETAPLDGATWLEPHQRDSVGSFNRWESTFQTIRRRAVVRVIPDAAGYLVEVVVEKELEHLPTPEKATAGAATFRNDSSLPSRRLEQASRTQSSPRWIQLGRDPPLEQQMLADIHARLGSIAATPMAPVAR
jgi:hypothetical protein